MTFTKLPTIEAVSRGLKLGVQPNTGTTLANQITAHNTAVDQALDALNTSEASINASITNVGDPDNADPPGDLYDALETHKLQRISSLKAIVNLWGQRGQLASDTAAEFQPQVATAETALSDAISTVETGLDALGINESTMIAGGWNADGARNSAAAKQQLRHIARQALPVRQAEAALAQIKNSVSAGIRQAHESERGKAEANKLLKSLAAKAVAASF